MSNFSDKVILQKDEQVEVKATPTGEDVEDVKEQVPVEQEQVQDTRTKDQIFVDRRLRAASRKITDHAELILGIARNLWHDTDNFRNLRSEGFKAEIKLLECEIRDLFDGVKLFNKVVSEQRGVSEGNGKNNN